MPSGATGRVTGDLGTHSRAFYDPAVKLHIGAMLVAFVVVPLASAHVLDSVPAGNYTLVDGPQAGVDIFVGGSGNISILDRQSVAHVVAAGRRLRPAAPARDD